MDVSLIGSYTKLQNTKIPLEERIEISRKIVSDTQCFLPNKKQVILDWSCQELSNIRSGEKSDKDDFKFVENEIRIWKILSEVLNDPESKIVLRQKHLTLLFRELDEIKSFLGKFCSDNGYFSDVTQDRLLSIFSCFQAISKNSNMSLAFFNKLENLEQYLKGILTCFLSVLLMQSHMHSADFVQELCHLVVIVLRQYNTVLCQQVAYHKNFINLCEKLLPLLLFGITVLKGDFCEVKDSSKKEISFAIEAVIISGLFHKDLVLNYNPAVIPQQQIEPSPKKQKLVNPYKQLFDVLESLRKDNEESTSIEGVNVTPDMIYLTISTSLPFLLESFLKVIQADEKADKANKFSFFVQLYNAVAPSGLAGNIPDVTRIDILNKMLKIIVDYDVCEIAEDEANDRPVFNWFINFLENVLFSQSHHNTGTYHCLDIILKLNHKIIEHFLEIVLAICFKKSKEDSISEAIDKAKAVLLRNIVETYTKLQQLENLVRYILKVFNELGNELGNISVDVLTKLSRSFEQCPLNQSLSILQYFLSKMKEKVQSMEHKDGCTDMSLEGISILFVTFVQNSSFNAADPHGLDQKKATSLEKLVRELKVAIIMPLINAFPMHRQTSQKQLGFSVLFLIHGLNSLVMFLHQHNVIPVSNDHYIEICWDSKVESFIPDEICRGLSILKKNRRLRFCMEILVVHRMRRLLLNANFDQNEYDHMVNILFNFQNSLTELEISSVTWNSDPQCVDSTNYPIAHWNLVTHYAPLFIPYCNEKQLQAFSEFMIRTLVHKGEESEQDDLTIYRISESILKNSELLVLPSLQEAVVKQIWILLGECMKQMVSDKLSDVFTWEASEDDVDEMEDSKNGNRERNLQPGKMDMNRATSSAQMIASVMNSGLLEKDRKEKNKKSNENLSMVARLLKVLQRLPCHHFTPSNKIRCILGSLACDVLLESCRDSHHTAAQLSCREIVTTLLQSLLQQREFSVWRVVDMAALLRWIYQTIPDYSDRNSAETPSNVERKFLDVSKELLTFAAALSLRLSSKGSQSTVDFSKERVASLAGSVDVGNPELSRCVEVLLIIIYAGSEFLEQKGSSSSTKTVRSVISEAAFGLTNFIKSILEDENSCQQKKGRAEMLVIKLVGVLTRAMKSFNDTKLSENKESTNAPEEWGEIVCMVVVKILGKMEDLGNSASGFLDVSDEMITFITVLTDVFKGSQEHCDHIPVELRARILRKCLEVLRDVGLTPGDGICEKESMTKESNKLEEVIRGLLASLLEENAGSNCIFVLENIIEWSIEKNEVSTLHTGFSVLRDLLTTKVAKQNKKKLRSIAVNIVITLLSKAVTNNEISNVVLETVAALVTLGAGVFYPHEVALVFQALSLTPEVTSLGSFSRIFMAKFNILSWTLFYYPDYVYGAVHVFLPFVRELLTLLLAQGAKMTDEKIKSEGVAIVLNCVEKMSRLYQEMASHKDVLSKYSIYFLADCVHVMCMHSVPEVMREALVQGVHFLFDICSDDGLQKLHVYLPSNERELFRSLKDDYMKHHKFKGNA
ncbi:unhealthy ribosome biogenesis protein 2 homolog [Dendronephthya gigantea]|uniref:unhealthy ribosome biogenesis protein 2 homolog n=1 Tax=Dendronephthya gigantea TaxID=151771 RepID=UPI00106D3304|nr:unhealthy ribosome biogenesis protein 2 homolog [Dendronephthya gigantea]